MFIPSPHQIGLPEKYQAWRSSQREALQWLLSRTKRIKVLCAPTGSGKTGIVLAYAALTKRPTCFVTDNRALQDQMMVEGKGLGLVDLRGRANYDCATQMGWSCEEGCAAKCVYWGSVNCPASRAQMVIAHSQFGVTNYAKWVASRAPGGCLDHFTQVVFDEGHQAPEALSKAMQILLNAKETEEDLGLDFPDQPKEMVNWKTWASGAKKLAMERLLDMRERLKNTAQPKRVWLRQYLHYRYLTTRLSILASATPEHWIVDETKQGYQFDPIRPGRYGEVGLLMGVPSIVFVSATIRPKTLFMIGVARESFDFLEMASDFDPARSPIYYVPTLRVDRRALDLSPLWVKLDQIAARRTDRKGIVQSISFSRRDNALAMSRFAGSMLVNPQGEASAPYVDAFRRSRPGTIFVSPSVGAGFDFPLKQCEWQFVCKIPFPHSSLIVKARTADDPEYPHYLAMSKLEQIFGRGMRLKEDQCENFIVDEHLDWFLPRYGRLASKTFHARFRQVAVIPAPPPRLA